MKRLETIAILAGSGRYPILLAEAARRHGVSRIVVAGFSGETAAELEPLADVFTRIPVAKLGALLSYLKKQKVRHAIMAGSITPGHLFDLRPDLKALLVLARLKERNAETIFGAVAEELGKIGVKLLPATTYLEDALPEPGPIAGPKLSPAQKEDILFGYRIAKEVSRLDIGQSVIVKNGTVLAVEAFEGTDVTMERGGRLGRGKAVLVKVSKPKQDFRFDVPVIGTRTLEQAQASGIKVIACEARRTLLLDRDRLLEKARKSGISLWATDGKNL